MPDLGHGLPVTLYKVLIDDRQRDDRAFCEELLDRRFADHALGHQMIDRVEDITIRYIGSVWRGAVSPMPFFGLDRLPPRDGEPHFVAAGHKYVTEVGERILPNAEPRTVMAVKLPQQVENSAEPRFGEPMFDAQNAVWGACCGPDPAP
jgi:hypothetical protein